MERPKLFRREAPQKRPPSGPGATILLGIDNLGALEELFGESLTGEIVGAIQRRILPALPPNARLLRAEQRRLQLSIPRIEHWEISPLVGHIQSRVAHHAITTSRGPVAVTLAAGIAPTQGIETEVHVAAARYALSEAMGAGVGCIRFADESEAAARRRDEIVGAAEVAMGALGRGDLVLAFQPVVNAGNTERAAFHECLVRVREESGNLLAAGLFMPAMERLGLATLVDRQVLVMALETLARQPSIRVSVNIYPQTMQDAQWMMIFAEGTARDPSLAERLIVEVTETAAMLEPARTQEFMDKLRGAGCAFALDDFGMGHTSFGNLRDFRFDMIKIDGSFVTDVTTNVDSRFFIEKLVEIAAHFDMMTVAEFVQGPAEARILRDLGVEYLQGFYFGKPTLTVDPEIRPLPAIFEAN